MTEITIHGTEFWIDGQPTYAGREFAGHKIQGLLFNVRAVQATFDDENPVTRGYWAYPDTGVWDPDRNTDEFCAALPAWRDHGVLAFTLNAQGGGARYNAEVYEYYDNSAFTREGALKPAYADRFARILAAADALGMVAIVGMFYWKHVLKMDGEPAFWRAAREMMDFLRETGRRNILVEIANETGPRFGFEIFHADRAHEMIDVLKTEYPEFLISTSQGGMDIGRGRELPPPSLVRSVDFIMPHGNGNTAEQLAAGLEAIQRMQTFQLNPKPILINEDSTGIANFDAAWRRYVSWGYYDQGFGGWGGYRHDIHIDYSEKPRESTYADLSGFQTPPVNWMINTPHKRNFFERVAEVTGYAEHLRE